MSVCHYSKKTEGTKKLSANFTVKEFACNDGTDEILINPELVEVLQKARTHFGKALIISSAYRTKTYNTKVGGSPNSQHLLGYAADTYINGVTPKQLYDYFNSLMPNTGGVGLYDGFCHVDVRAKKSRWDYRKKK